MALSEYVNLSKAISIWTYSVEALFYVSNAAVRNFINAVPYTAIDDDEDDDSSLHSSSDHTGTTERLHALEGGFNNTNNEFLAESLQNIESMLTTSQQSDDSSNVNRQRADHFLSQTMDYRGRRIWGEEAWTQGIGPNGRPLQ